MAIVNRATPFDLLIENQYRDQATPVLYIVSAEREDDDSQHVRFKFSNRGDIAYELNSLKQANADNYHFALVFRPSTLKYSSAEEIQSKFQAAIGDNWLVSTPLVQEDTTEAIYFSAKEKRLIKKNESVSFLVKGLSGAAATGSRSTQVQLLFRESVGDSYIVRTRNQHLDVVNHDGKTFAPLEFVVLGAPTIVHRSMENTVRMQMIETNGRKILVSEHTSIDFKVPFYSKEYDPDYHPAWVFGDSSKVNNIVCQIDKKETTTITIDSIGDDDILGKAGEPTDSGMWGYKSIRATFETGESIDNLILEFINVPADGPIGDARIKVTVCNLPGYWDTEFEVIVEKTLLTTDYYEPWKRSFGLLNNQVIVGKDLPDGWQKEGALHSSLSVTSANVRDENPLSEVDKLLCLHDGKIGMQGMDIAVGNWQERQDSTDPPQEDDTNLKGGYLIKAGQYNHGPRFNVDFFGNAWADGEITSEKGLSTAGAIAAKGDISTEGRIKDSTGDVMPVGAIIAFGGSEAPDGWLPCDGRSIADDDKYLQLREVLGKIPTKSESGVNVWWGDKDPKALIKVEYVVPDLTHKFIVGAGSGMYYRCGTGGEDKHTLTIDEMPKHKHTGTTSHDGAHEHTNLHWRTLGTTGSDKDTLARDTGAKWEDGKVAEWGSDHKHSFTTQISGDDQSHNNLPPYYALTYIIKY